MSLPVVQGVGVFDWNVIWTKWSDFGNAVGALPDREQPADTTPVLHCHAVDRDGDLLRHGEWRHLRRERVHERGSSPCGCHQAGC